AHQRRFVVVTPNGDAHDVLVEIDGEVVGYVERLTGRRLPPENSFWTIQAHHLLTDFLWNQGQVPPTRRLVVSNLDPDKLPIAARWGNGRTTEGV
ncbi:MAG TPA: hypothetical protein VFR12_03965, partial [Pyrinomonadaceae bacterium]|nr:hypothetical protein [Pyrinomonadaceae bacterium]